MQENKTTEPAEEEEVAAEAEEVPLLHVDSPCVAADPVDLVVAPQA